MSPRKTARRRRATTPQEVAFTLVEVTVPKVAQLFVQLVNIWGSAAGRVSVVYGFSDILAALRTFYINFDVGFTPFQSYRRLSVAVNCIVFGFGANANVTLLPYGGLIEGGAEVRTPVIEVACSGRVSDIGGILSTRRARKAEKAYLAEEAAAQAVRDARNAKRRATRARNIRRAARR